MLIAAPNIQICASHILTGIEAISTPNGGSASGYQEPVSARSAIPTTAEQAGGRAVCLCIASAGRGHPLLPRTARRVGRDVVVSRPW